MARFVCAGPDDLDTACFDTGTFHSTKLLFELDPASDLPHGKDYRALVDRLNPGHEVTGEGEEFRVRVLPRIEGGREVYGIVGLPEVNCTTRSRTLLAAGSEAGYVDRRKDTMT